MCTLIIARNCLPGIPVALGANRDELMQRPFGGPRIWEGNPKVLAPKDETAGGTWIGLSGGGFLAAITNRMGEPQHEGRRSRGLLCLEVLRAATLRGALQTLNRRLDAEAYNGFNLFLADRREAWVYSVGEGGVEAQELGSGTHVVTSRHDLNPPLLESTRLSAQGVVDGATLASTAEDHWVRGMTTLLGDAGEHFDGYAVCKHGALYGTKSSSIITLHGGGDASFYFSSGRPCEAPFVKQALVSL